MPKTKNDNRVEAKIPAGLSPELIRDEQKKADLFCFGMMRSLNRSVVYQYPGDLITTINTEIESEPEIKEAFDLFCKLRNFQGTPEEQTELFDILARKSGVSRANRANLEADYATCLKAAQTIDITMKDALYDAKMLAEQEQRELESLAQKTKKVREQITASYNYNKDQTQNPAEQAALKARYVEETAALTQEERKEKAEIRKTYEDQRVEHLEEKEGVITAKFDEILTLKTRADERFKITNWIHKLPLIGGKLFPGADKVKREKDTREVAARTVLENIYFPHMELPQFNDNYKAVKNEDGSISIFRLGKVFNHEICKITHVANDTHIKANLENREDAMRFVQDIIANFTDKRVTITLSESCQFKGEIQKALTDAGFYLEDIVFEIKNSKGVIKTTTTALQEALKLAHTEDERKRIIDNEKDKAEKKNDSFTAAKSSTLTRNIHQVLNISTSTKENMIRLGNLAAEVLLPHPGRSPEETTKATKAYEMECKAIAEDPAAAFDVRVQTTIIEDRANAAFTIALPADNILMLITNPPTAAGGQPVLILNLMNNIDGLRTANDGANIEIAFATLHTAAGTASIDLIVQRTQAQPYSVIHRAAVALQDSLKNLPVNPGVGATPEQQKKYEDEMKAKKKEVLARYADFVDAEKAHQYRAGIAQKIAAEIKNSPNILTKDLNGFISLVAEAEGLHNSNKDFANALLRFTAPGGLITQLLTHGHYDEKPAAGTIVNLNQEIDQALDTIITGVAGNANRNRVPAAAMAAALPAPAVPILDTVNDPVGKELLSAVNNLKEKRQAYVTAFPGGVAAPTTAPEIKADAELAEAANRFKTAVENAQALIEKQQFDVVTLPDKQNIRDQLILARITNANAPAQRAALLIADNQNSPQNKTFVANYLKVLYQRELITLRIARLNAAGVAAAGALGGRLTAINNACNNNITTLALMPDQMRALQRLQHDVNTAVVVQSQHAQPMNGTFAALVLAEAQYSRQLTDELQKTPEGQKVLNENPELAESLRNSEEVRLRAYLSALIDDLNGARLTALFPNPQDQQAKAKATNQIPLLDALLAKPILTTAEVAAITQNIPPGAAGNIAAINNLARNQVVAILDAAEKAALPPPADVTAPNFEIRRL